MGRSSSICMLVGVALFAGAVLAQTPPAGTPPTPPPQAPGPPLSLSLEAAQTAMATCAANGYKVAVVVVDSAGAVRVALAADGVNPRAVDFVQRKVATVIKYGEPSAALQEKVKTDTALAATISADPKLVARAGALPIKSKDVIIGAIGVGGAPGGDKDDVCSLAGIEKIKDRL
jgi:uncharacterized protein GlcG (DUF336 family)